MLLWKKWNCNVEENIFVRQLQDTKVLSRNYDVIVNFLLRKRRSGSLRHSNCGIIANFALTAAETGCLGEEESLYTYLPKDDRAAMTILSTSED